MEELGVFVPLANRPTLPSLPPVSALPENRGRKGEVRVTAEGRFSCRESSVFFQKIEKINQEATVIIEGGYEPVLLFRNLGSVPKGFVPSSNDSRSARAMDCIRPGGKSGGEEGLIKKPSIFEEKPRRCFGTSVEAVIRRGT